MEMPWWFTIDGRTDYWMFDSETEKFGNAPAMIKDFKSLVPTDLHRHIVLGVGDTVALDIEFAMPAQARKEVRASLTRQLSKRGVTLDSASNVRIKISQKITTESKQYRDRFYGSLSTVKAKRYDQTIALVNGNQTLLSHRELLGGTPNTLKMKEGETVQQAFERTRPGLSYDFFKNFSLPNVIAAHPDQKPFSSITFDAF